LDPTYIAYRGFLSGFLHDWSVRTENPWEANLFYVPALTFAYSSNLGDVTEHLHRVMTWVREAHPFFNRTGGRDHFFWLPNDRWGSGSCPGVSVRAGSLLGSKCFATRFCNNKHTSGIAESAVTDISHNMWPRNTQLVPARVV